MNLIIGLLIGIIGGGALVFVLLNTVLKGKSEKLLKDAENEGEAIKKEKILQAKERFLKLKEEHEDTMKQRERKLQSIEDKARNQEKQLSQKIEETSRKEKTLEKEISDLEAKRETLDVRQHELDKIHQKQVAELSKISGMSIEEAKNGLIEALRDEARTEALAHIKEISEEAKLNATKKQRKSLFRQFNVLRQSRQ